MTRRSNGGIIGQNAIIGIYTASGIWSLTEQSVLAATTSWPGLPYIVDILAVGAGGGGGGNDGASAGCGGGSGGVVYGSMWAPTGQLFSITVGTGGGAGGSDTTSGMGTGGWLTGGWGGNAGGTGSSGGGAAGGGASAIFTGTTFLLVAGGGAGGGGGGEGTLNDVQSCGGGMLYNSGTNSLFGGWGIPFSGDGGGGAGGGGGWPGGRGQENSSNSTQASGGGNYTNTNFIFSATCVLGNLGKVGGTGGASTVTSWTGYSNNAGAGGNNTVAGSAGTLIIRYAGYTQRARGGTVSTGSGYTYHTFASTSTGIIF